MKNNKKSAFICDLCCKTFSKKFILLRHILSIHKTQTAQFICNECNKEFQRKDNLSRHVLTHYSKEAYTCTLCHQNCSSERSLLFHKYKRHAIVPENENSIRPFKCHHCSMEFIRKYNIARHIRACHSTNVAVVERKLNRKCLNCNENFLNKYKLRKHYKEVHGIELEFEYLHFSSIAVLHKWISSYYFKEGRWKTSADIVTRYRCHRSGSYTDNFEKNNSKRKRHMKIGGTKKLQGFCPAEITIRENRRDKSCIATYQKVHVGHNIHDQATELMFKRSKKAEKQDIALRLIENLPEDAVLRNIYDVQKGNVNRRNIHNIGVSCQITSCYTLENDTDSVNAFIRDNRESILFYKAQGEKDSVYEGFLDDDLALIYQDAIQKEYLFKYGHKFVSFDVTHRTNPYDYLLHTMLVLNVDCEGIPVAYLICNRSDQLVIDAFIRCIRNHVGALVTQTVMSDTDEVYHNAFRSIMSPPLFNIFCTWHVQKEWNQQLTELITVTGQPVKSKRNSEKSETNRSRTNKSTIVESQMGGFNACSLKVEEQKSDKLDTGHRESDYPLNAISAEKRRCLKKDIKNQLTALVNELDHVSFECKLNSFLSISDINAKPFIDYFKEKYVNKAQYWAACYRIYAGANTNMHMEAFHRVLKHTIGRTRKLQTLAAGLDCIKNYNIYRHNKFESKILGPYVSKKLENLRRSHREAEDGLEKQSFTIEVFDNDSWHVGSFSDTAEGVMEMYLVKKLEVRECNLYDEPCGLRCIYCKSCFHEYRCTCFNSAIANNMCKHIHALLLSSPTGENMQVEAPSESILFPVVSLEMPSTMSDFHEDSSQSELNNNLNYESAKKMIQNTMEELLQLIVPENVDNFNCFYEEHIRPLPSIFKAMLSQHEVEGLKPTVHDTIPQ